MYMQGFLLFCDKIEMNKSPSLHMAFINFPEIFQGQKGQAQQRKSEYWEIGPMHDSSLKSNTPFSGMANLC